MKIIKYIDEPFIKNLIFKGCCKFMYSNIATLSKIALSKNIEDYFEECFQQKFITSKNLQTIKILKAY